MFKRSVTVDDLVRLKAEREAADDDYNRTLTRLDESVTPTPELPHAPPPFDDRRVSPLNEQWQLIPTDGPDLGGGWRGRLRGVVWTLVAPLFQQQQTFNASLVDHINRNVPSARENQKATASLIALVGGQLEALATFESCLVQFLQQLTPYVDTKDLEAAGIMRRITEDVAEVTEQLDARSRGLVGSLSGVSDELRKRWESTVVREQRFVQHVEELRTTVGQVQHGLLAVRRELERRPAADGVATNGDAKGRVDEAVDAYTYVGFENLYRGAQEEIRGRLVDYVPLFEGASDVLDVGCGRGEFLDLLREQGIAARGLDINSEMVEECRSRGLEATVGDALEHLDGLADGSLGGLFAAQVVEHLQPEYLVRFLNVAGRKLGPGAKIVLETINPGCWFAFFDGYIRDITHVRPLHPDTLTYLLAAAGFQRTSVRYSAPYPEHGKLQHVTPGEHGSDTRGRLADAVAILNENADKLNGLLFTHMDYAAIGERV